MQPLSGPGAPIPSDHTVNNTTPSPQSAQPLSPTQRTTLERLMVKIMSLSTLKSAELWAGLRHEVGVKNDAGLLSHHFPAAEQFLNTRLSQVQNTHASRQLFQQLSDLLPQGNNRQAVSDFIRQQFGLTVLSSLNPDQMRQVLTMLQNGQIAIPQPQQSHITDRTLLPAEHHTLNQQVAKLAAATGEQPARLWFSVLKIVNLHNGDPIPSRLFPLLTQYLQASQTLSQHTTLTLPMLLSLLKVPPDNVEQKMLEDASQQRFHLATQAVLTSVQAQDLLNLLFTRRAARLREPPLTADEINPLPPVASRFDYASTLLRPLTTHPLLTTLAVFILLALLLWCWL
ncbi:flagella biosynthesis regulator Flk [Erwinia endophytica]|uniref:flagella biosynthesis regulator Flk n=1 Tax=Erwinia endophytica TaxID=1563158 RepID=UPI001265F93C|nr:flagella biosynthesis regulator Flk [Erwinia endophytica]KAB8312182.1 flagella biosynthesis regulator Flk [Erwinia endophytica]